MAWPTLERLKHGHGENYPLPVAFLRSGLFSSMRYRGRERPQYAEKTEVPTYGGSAISQLSGEQLDGNDLDVIAGCIRHVYDAGALTEDSVTVQFQEKEFLRQIGWKTGGSQRDALAQSLQRMQDATFEFAVISSKHGEKNGLQTSLITNFSRRFDRNRASYCVTLSGDIAPLMQAGWSLVRRMQRNALRDEPLAQALHAFYETHSQPIPLKEEILRPLMQRNGKRGDKWRGSLQAALTALQAVTKWECELSDKRMVTIGKPEQAKKTNKQPATRPEPVTQPLYDGDI